MWVRTVLILLLSAVSGLPRDSDYLYEDANGDEDVSFYGNYDISVITMPVLTTAGVETHTRIRTYGVGEKNTHSPEEIKNIKVVLQDSVSNGKVKPRAAEDPGKVYISNSYQYFEESPEQHGFTQKTESNKGELRDLVRSWMTTDSSKPHHSDAYQYLEDLQVSAQNSEKITSIQGVATVFTLSPSIVTWVPEPTYNHSKKASKPNHLTLPPREIEDIKDVPKEMIFNQGATTWHHEEQDKDYATKSIKYTFVSQKAIDDSDGNEALQNIFPNRRVVSWAAQSITPGTPYSEASWVLTPIMNLTEVLDEDISTLPANKIMEYIAQNTENWEPFEADVNSSNIVGVLRQEGQTNSTIDDYTNSTITVEPTTPPKPTIRLDVQGLLDLIANLTYDYDMNLTQRFNETLAKFSVPSCGSPTTTVTPTTVPPEHDFANTSIVAKCFVCGLDKQEIPQDSYCADAFAGEFIPLMPVNPRARGQIATYRKYCRYLDV